MMLNDKFGAAYSMKPFVLIKKFRPKRAAGIFLLICFALCAVPLGQHITEIAAAKSGQPLKGNVIAVDAGHGGFA